VHCFLNVGRAFQAEPPRLNQTDEGRNRAKRTSKLWSLRRHSLEVCFDVFKLVAFIIKIPINPICLNSFTIKSRSARRHLRKIWL